MECACVLTSGFFNNPRIFVTGGTTGKEFHNSKIESQRSLYKSSGVFSFLYMSKKLVKLSELEFIAGMQLE